MHRREKKKSIQLPIYPTPVLGKKSAVVNLSTVLTPAQLALLELGLSLVPTSSVSPFELFLDLHKFFRDVNLKKFWAFPTDLHWSKRDQTSLVNSKQQLCPQMHLNKSLPQTWNGVTNVAYIKTGRNKEGQEPWYGGAWLAHPAPCCRSPTPLWREWGRLTYLHEAQRPDHSVPAADTSAVSTSTPSTTSSALFHWSHL